MRSSSRRRKGLAITPEMIIFIVAAIIGALIVVAWVTGGLHGLMRRESLNVRQFVAARYIKVGSVGYWLIAINLTNTGDVDTTIQKVLIGETGYSALRSYTGKGSIDKLVTTTGEITDAPWIILFGPRGPNDRGVGVAVVDIGGRPEYAPIVDAARYTDYEVKLPLVIKAHRSYMFTLVIGDVGVFEHGTMLTIAFVTQAGTYSVNVWLP